MEESRYWFKAVKLPCALEQAVLSVRVIEREESWTIPLYRTVNGVGEATGSDMEVENGIIIPPEDPLLLALDKIRQHHDEAAIGNVFLNCWGTLMQGDGFHERIGSDLVTPSSKDEAAGSRESSPIKDRATIFEISDGIQTEIDGMFKDLKLVGESEHVLDTTAPHNDTRRGR